MRELPSVAETEHQLAAVIRHIADAAQTIAPGLRWETDTNRGQATLGCPAAYRETEGVSMSTDRLVSTAPLNDTDWPRILDLTRDIAAQHGITALTIRADEPGNHDVFLPSPDHGNQIRMGTRKAAPLTGHTGCRYTAQDLEQQPGL